MNERCPVCKHEVHKPGKCEFDNCGSSEVIEVERTPNVDLDIQSRRNTRNPTSTELHALDRGKRKKPKKGNQ